MDQSKLYTAHDQLHRAWLTVVRSKRHLWKGVVVVAVFTMAALVFSVVRGRIYLSETVLLYRQIINPRLLGGSNEDRLRVKDIGVRLGEILLSRPNLKRVIEKFKLYPDLVAENRQVDAVEKMRLAVTFRVRPGDTIHISFTGETPKQAQQVTAYLAERLIEEDRRLRSEQATTTGKFINSELKRVRAELEQREREIARFIALHPEFARVTTPGAGTAGASIRAQGVKKGAPPPAPGVRPDYGIRALRRQRKRILERLATKAPTPRVIRDPRIEEAHRLAEQELAREKRRLARLRTQFTDLHPDIQAAMARVRAAQEQLARVARLLKSTSRVEKPVSTVDKKALEAELEQIEQKILAHRRRANRRSKPRVDEPKFDVKDETASRIVALEIEWSKLNRNVAETRDRYLQLEARQFQALLSTSSELSQRASQIEIIDPAYLPVRPSGIGRTVIVGGGFAISIVLAVSLMLILAVLDNRVYRQVDFERLNIEIPVLTVVPPPESPAKKRRLLRG
jgi:uncharacterized protein involved in exopolysaccharide biosynthesis